MPLYKLILAYIYVHVCMCVCVSVCVVCKYTHTYKHVLHAYMCIYCIKAGFICVNAWTWINTGVQHSKGN